LVRTIKIVVLQRGWVVVGEYAESDGKAFITCASVVRRWGTTKGLGELAANGPLTNTVLDRAGVVTVPLLGVVLAVDCDPVKWEAACRPTE
jgi:hypothetical protein